ncbi:MAG: hypothetical protein WCX79_00380 [Candidatus Paceibacterota bacterium]|jgi:hypothetical protein
MKEELLGTGILISLLSAVFAGCLGGVTGIIIHSFIAGILLAITVGTLMLFVEGSPIYA